MEHYTETNKIRNALKPLFLLSEYVSMCSLGLNKNNKQTHMKLSREGFISTLIILGFYIYSILWSFKWVESMSTGMDIFANIGNALQMLSGTVCVIAVIIEKIFYGKLVPEWYYELIRIDQGLKLFSGLMFNYRKMRVVITTLLSFALMTLAIIFCTSTIIMYLVGGFVSVYHVNLIVTPTLYAFLSTLRFISNMYLIRDRISNANMLLRIYHNDNELSKIYTSSNPSSNRLVNIEKIYKKCHCVVQSISEYCSLLETSNFINELVSVVNCLSILLMTMFTIFYIIYNPVSSMPVIKYASFMAMTVCLGFMHVLLLYLIRISTNCTIQVIN